MADLLPQAWLNGEFLPLDEARISPLDRGFLFGDSVYEVIPVYGGRPLGGERHLQRLARSLRELRMPDPRPGGWSKLVDEMIERNGGGDQYVYIQVTRGAPHDRDHAFPAAADPTVFLMAGRLPAPSPDVLEHGVAAITVEDRRWRRCDIKTTAVPASVLARQEAVDAGAREAIFIRDGRVTEGAATTVLAVIRGRVVTPPDSGAILPGTTRDLVVELLESAGVAVQRRPLSVDELHAAGEVWLASSTMELTPVTRLDGRPVGDGRPGPEWRRARTLFVAARTEDSP